MSVNKVLIGVDGSQGCWRALDFAATLAKQTGAKLEVAAVVDLGQLDFYDGMYLTPEQVEQLQSRVKTEVLEEALSRLPSDVKAETKLLRGRAGKVLIQHAEAGGVSCIVVGRTGRGFIERFTEGSVSRRLTAHSPVPVVVVP